MPINFQPYIPQAPDLLTPAMNMQKLQQGQQELEQEQQKINLLRENQQAEKQKMEADRVNKIIDNWKTITSIGGEETGINYYESNSELQKIVGIDTKKLDPGRKKAFQKSANTYLDAIDEMKKNNVDPKYISDYQIHARDKLNAEFGGEEGQRKQTEALFPEKKAEIGAVSPDKFTPESMAKYQQTGNYGDLVSTVKPGKQIERTIDLGDKQRVIYTDGTEEDLPKGVSPNTAIKINMGDQRGDARFAMNLRKEFNALQPVKDYRDITTKYNVMTEAFKESKKTNNYVAVDQALITLYNKMTDPQSVVRESEYVRTPQDMAIMDRMESAMIRVAKGGRLESDTRQAIMTMAGKFKKAYESKYNEIANEYRGYAGSSGVEPDNVVKQVKEEKQQTRNISKAVTYLKSSKDRNDAKNRMKALMSASGEEGNWTDEELREIERQAGY